MDKDSKLVKGNSEELFSRLISLATAYLKSHPEVETVIQGCAMGWDLALGVAAQDLGISVHSYVPYKGHGKDWKTFYREVHAEVLSKSAEIYAPDVPFSRETLLQRNKDMVDSADYVLALWDGSPGGTKHCVNYANLSEKKVVNLWKNWKKYQQAY